MTEALGDGLGAAHERSPISSRSALTCTLSDRFNRIEPDPGSPGRSNDHSTFEGALEITGKDIMTHLKGIHYEYDNPEPESR
jgi:hypothetical protein